MNTEQALKSGAKILNKALAAELRAQGHHLTGTLEASIKDETTSSGPLTKVSGSMLYYGKILHFGTDAARVPFNPGSGKGESKYIAGLTEFFIQRGLGADEAVRAAFATAKKQKAEGMPTNASSRFSKDGQRRNFISNVNDRSAAQVKATILANLRKMISDVFHKTKSETI